MNRYTVLVLVVQVQEWTDRQRNKLGHAIVGVHEHTAAAQQVATFALSQEEESVSWYHKMSRQNPSEPV